MTTTPGVFILSLSEVAGPLIFDQPRVVKAWASTGPYWAEYKRLVPDSYIIARQFWRAEEQQAVLAGQRNVAPLTYGLFSAMWGFPWSAAIGFNEYIHENASHEEWLRAITIEKAFAARARAERYDYWALSMSVGHLPPDWVVQELAADTNITGLSIHAYWWNQPPWEAPHLARLFDFIRQSPLDVLIGEVGRDYQAERGWQKQGVSCAAYTDEIRWFLKNCP